MQRTSETMCVPILMFISYMPTALFQEHFNAFGFVVDRVISFHTRKATHVQSHWQQNTKQLENARTICLHIILIMAWHI